MVNTYNYSRQFGFEKDFDHAAFLEWMHQNWTLAFWYSGCYALLILAGTQYMKNRPKFEIRSGLTLWSASLAIFSIFGAARTIPELIYSILDHGFDYSVCDTEIYVGPTAFWTFMFAISKVYELGDTAFIVLRKQRLIFLHWYHHITVLCYVWYSYIEHTAPGRWFIVMNYSVHAFMYTYYTFKACRCYVPKWVNICITSMQILQMFIGIGINMRSYFIKSAGGSCSQSWENLIVALVMYLSYLVLFSKYFYETYIKAKPAVKPTQNGMKAQNGTLGGKPVQNGIKHAHNGTVGNGITKKML